MTDHEHIEKVRQEIMRFRELLTIMEQRAAEGEHAYDQLFANVDEADKKTLKEKDLQWQVAEQLVESGDDLSSLSKAVGRMRFESHELERAFEELYDIIVTPYVE